MIKKLLSIIVLGFVLSATPKPLFAAGQECCSFSGYNGTYLIPNTYIKPSVTSMKCERYSATDTRLETGPAWNCAADGTESCDLTIGVVPVPNSKNSIHGQCYVKPEAPKPQGNCGGANQIDTAIGCIDSTYENLIGLSLRIGVGFGSGIAFLLILWGSFKMLTSQGQPDRINAGKETITSAIIGLVFIVLSVTLLQIIGFDILGLGALGLGSR